MYNLMVYCIVFSYLFLYFYCRDIMKNKKRNLFVKTTIFFEKSLSVAMEMMN